MSSPTLPTKIQETVPMNPRAYQLEMLEECLKRNVIVAMDTGSGKTQVAVLRIKRELDVASSEKLVWFLTPTVELSLQQFDVLRSQISSVQIKCFTSRDNVDRWKEKADWDVVLTNVKIAVSTYAVLHEALFHAFIKIESLALIVFDEAHNCTGRSPGSKIMQDFYWPKRKEELSVPHILGLTASPVMGSNLSALETLESLLDSTCKSPHIQKEDLLLHVKRPTLIKVIFDGDELAVESSYSTCTMASLLAVYHSLDIHEDPEIVRLRTENSEVSRNKLERALEKEDTFIQKQMRSFCRTSREIHKALGHWAADFYIFQVISGFIQYSESKDIGLLGWAASEKMYLANALRGVKTASATPSVKYDEMSISNKVHALIDFLKSCTEKAIGIIFVKERATAYLLYHLLSGIPDIRKRFRLGTIIGTSKRPPGKWNICELVHLENQTKTLAKFRSGEINLVIATSVLEEGIDVPQCNLVVCFDETVNLKSFVQCRGRARLRESKLVVFVDNTSVSLVSKWQELELEMKKRYEENDRNIQMMVEDELGDAENRQRRKFVVESTGALLDMENAKGHLQCFCSRLSSHPYAGMQPEYIIKKGEKENGKPDSQPLFHAKVVLPASLDPTLQKFYSREMWHSEKNATKDAAFEAYVALYNAGLVDEHLLPFDFTETSRYMEKQDSIIEIQEQFDPWLEVARAWESKEKLHRRALTLKDQHGLKKCEIEMVLPVSLPDMKTILIHWDVSTKWKIEIGLPASVQNSRTVVDHTTTLLSLAYRHRWEVEEMRHMVVFNAGHMEFTPIRLESLSSTHHSHTDDSIGLVRQIQSGRPYFFHRWLSTKPPEQSVQRPHRDYESFGQEQPFLALKRWSRHSDFLHPIIPDPRTKQRSAAEYFGVLPKSLVSLDIIPARYSQFGLLIPSILHKVEVMLVVKELCATVLSNVEIPNFELIQTAISSPVAREQDNYQKLEFLGDSVLKLLVCVFAASKYPRYPEGYLSDKKDSIVSNSRLCEAALERGLDKFILTKVFTGSKWRPRSIESALRNAGCGTRDISSKTVADVVESLIGAGWKMGCFATSLSVLKVFLPEVDLPSLEVGRTRLFDIAPDNIPLQAALINLETLVGYSFVKKSLLVQSMSHGSYRGPTASYERLEFLGDAILEILIVNELLIYEDRLPHSLMHLYRTALVHGDYLGFIALEWKIVQTRKDLKENEISGLMTEVESQFSLPLWRFMSHESVEICRSQPKVECQHATLRCKILDAIESGTRYPWATLARLRANKFYSDLVESLLGAVWVDSGSLDICKQVLERMGILGHLHRLIQDQVHVLHPREEMSILAGDKKVTYDVHMPISNEDCDEWACALYVGEEKVAEVAHGVSEDEVKTRAAELAVSLLTGSPIR